MMLGSLIFVGAIALTTAGVLSRSSDEFRQGIRKLPRNLNEVQARYLASNVIEIEWMTTTNSSDNLVVRNPVKASVEVDDSVAQIRIRVSDGGSCDEERLEYSEDCVLTRSKSCTFWDLKVTSRNLHSFCLFDGIGGRRIEMFSFPPEIRQPPLIQRVEITLEFPPVTRHSNLFQEIEVISVETNGVAMFCEASGSPKPKLSWCLNNSPSPSSTSRSVCAEYMRNHDGRRGRLEIVNASKADEGSYTCVAENEYGITRSPPVHLKLPELHKFPTEHELSVSVVFGRSVQLDCNYPAEDFSTISFNWGKSQDNDGRTVSPVILDERVIQTFEGSLVFLHTRHEDNGFYMCTVKNTVSGVTGGPTKLTITGIETPFSSVPLSMSKKDKILHALVGTNVRLQCIFGGKPVPTLTWTANGTIVTNTFKYRLLGEGNHTLEIKNLTFNDNTDYECEAVNKEGRSNERVKYHLELKEIPRFPEPLMSRNVTIGNKVEFSCLPAGTPIPSIWWEVNDTAISDLDGRWNYTMSHDKRHVTFYNVTRDHVSNLRCVARNDRGRAQTDAYLNVFAPTKIIQGPDDVILDGQPAVSFHCKVESDETTPVSIEWIRGNKPIIEDHPRIYITRNKSLVLNFTGEEDGGNSFIATYTCHASNGMTTDRQSARLRTLIASASKDGSGFFSSSNLPAVFKEYYAWFALIGGLVLIFAISLTVAGILQRRSKKTAGMNYNYSINRTVRRPDGGIKMKRCSRQSRSGKPSESRMCLKKSSSDNVALHNALQEMFIERDKLKMGNTIGRGQFGRVFSAILLHDRQKIEMHVAVKTMKYKPEETEMAELFLREAVLMKDFQHVHVLGVIGVTFDPDGSPMVILPFMANGDLRKYIMNSQLDITVLQLLKMSLQVTRGMIYLSEMRFVHRDLAARNCMVDERGIVKVADFGLSRELIFRDYYRLNHTKTPVPVRWMAPECLEANVFTTMSDVWSFGVLLWELVTRGAVPFSDIENWEVSNHVQSGKRLPQPLYCPDSIYRIMLNCWDEEPYHRPSFEDLARDIDRIVLSAQSLPYAPCYAVPFYSNSEPSSPTSSAPSIIKASLVSIRKNSLDLEQKNWSGN